MKAPFVRSAYNYDVDEVSNASGLTCSDASLAKQSFREECDINTIVRNFGLTGQLPDDVRPPTYGDFSGIFDFHSAMNAVAEAQEAFDALPAEVRARFHNDPGAFVDFCSNPENLPDLRKMGLAVALNPETDDLSVKGAEGAAQPAKPLDGAPAQ